MQSIDRRGATLIVVSHLGDISVERLAAKALSGAGAEKEMEVFLDIDLLFLKVD
jgi:hypothetical protein